MLAALYALLQRTFLGRAIRACSASRDGASLVGIDVERTMAQMFAIGSATTGFAGAALSVLYQFVPDSHSVWIGRVLCVVILGGLGSFLGAALGAAVLGISEATDGRRTSTPDGRPRFRTSSSSSILVVRPQGLLGGKLRADGALA